MPMGTGTSTAQAQAATYSYQRPVGCEKGLALFWLDISSSRVCEAPCKHHPPHHLYAGSTKV